MASLFSGTQGARKASVLWEAQTEQVQAGDYGPERDADSKQSKSADDAGCQFKH
jgi:hypothetical protein